MLRKQNMYKHYFSSSNHHVWGRCINISIQTFWHPLVHVSMGEAEPLSRVQNHLWWSSSTRSCTKVVWLHGSIGGSKGPSNCATSHPPNHYVDNVGTGFLHHHHDINRRIIQESMLVGCVQPTCQPDVLHYPPDVRTSGFSSEQVWTGTSWRLVLGSCTLRSGKGGTEGSLYCQVPYPIPSTVTSNAP